MQLVHIPLFPQQDSASLERYRSLTLSIDYGSSNSVVLVSSGSPQVVSRNGGQVTKLWMRRNSTASGRGVAAERISNFDFSSVKNEIARNIVSVAFATFFATESPIGSFYEQYIHRIYCKDTVSL
jgi:hypothetical protein